MNKILTKLILLTLLSPLVFLPLQADQYMVEFKFMTAPVQWIKENQLKHTPKEVSKGIFKTVMESTSVSILSSPRVTAKANQAAKIVIQEEPLAYMEKVGDGYQPRRMPKGTGPGLELTVRMSGVEKKPGHCLLNWSTKVNTLSGRESVQFGLDVGKPIIQTQQYESVVECFNDRWYFLTQLASFNAGTEESALIFCKVQKIQNDAGSTPKDFPIKVVSDKVSYDNGVLKAKGNVRIQEGNFVIYSDKLEFIHEPKDTKGPAIQADKMFLETPESRIRYSGNVRLRINGGLIHSDELYIQQLVETPKLESAFEKRLKQTIIPSLSFKEVSLPDAIDFLREMSAQHSPDGKRVEFVITPEVLNMDTGLTLTLRNISLFHIVRVITEACGQEFKLDEEAGVVIIM